MRRRTSSGRSTRSGQLWLTQSRPITTLFPIPVRARPVDSTTPGLLLRHPGPGSAPADHADGHGRPPGHRRRLPDPRRIPAGPDRRRPGGLLGRRGPDLRRLHHRRAVPGGPRRRPADARHHGGPVGGGRSGDCSTTPGSPCCPAPGGWALRTMAAGRCCGPGYRWSPPGAASARGLPLARPAGPAQVERTPAAARRTRRLGRAGGRRARLPDPTRSRSRRRCCPPRLAGLGALGCWPGGSCGELATTRIELETVLRGLPDNVTTEMDLQLWELAGAVRADPAAAEALLGTDAAELAPRYRARHSAAGAAAGADGVPRRLRASGRRRDRPRHAALVGGSDAPARCAGRLPAAGRDRRCPRPRSSRTAPPRRRR